MRKYRKVVREVDDWLSVSTSTVNSGLNEVAVRLPETTSDLPGLAECANSLDDSDPLHSSVDETDSDEFVQDTSEQEPTSDKDDNSLQDDLASWVVGAKISRQA